jgi:hypothetical protein
VYIRDFFKKKSNIELVSIPMVREFHNVFLEKLPGLPSDREIKVSIELLLGTTLIT